MSRVLGRVAIMPAMLLAARVWLACGTNVDLGGDTESDAAAADAPARPDVAIDRTPPATDGGTDDCEPCASSQDCRATAECVQIGGDAGERYCVTLCPTDAGCSPERSCKRAVTSAGLETNACLPNLGTCPMAEPVTGADGAAIDQCGSLVGPSVPGPCVACRFDCQANGCYGGWWCNTVTHRCERPPHTCP